MNNKLAYYAKVAQHRLGCVAGQLELTSKCMQKCPMCKSWQDSEPSGIFGVAYAAQLWHDLNQRREFEHLSLTGGDPQCYPNLRELALYPRNFRLQISTAMMKKPEPWYKYFDRVRISLDTLDPVIYEKMRGVQRKPFEVFDWLAEVDIEFATITTVNEHNVEDLIPMLLEMENQGRRFGERYRKAIFMLELGRELPAEVVGEFFRIGRVAPNQLNLPTSFGESIDKTRKMVNDMEQVGNRRCAVGDISFHIKCNGDVYPCCLIGGEAIETQTDFRLGNYFMARDISRIMNAHRSTEIALFYRWHKVCRDVCQWKQAEINRLAEEAGKTRVSIP